MISAKFLWGNVLLREKLQMDAKISNFEFFESALYKKSVSMPLRSATGSMLSKIHNVWSYDRHYLWLVMFMMKLQVNQWNICSQTHDINLINLKAEYQRLNTHKIYCYILCSF